MLRQVDIDILKNYIQAWYYDAPEAAEKIQQSML